MIFNLSRNDYAVGHCIRTNVFLRHEFRAEDSSQQITSVPHYSHSFHEGNHWQLEKTRILDNTLNCPLVLRYLPHVVDRHARSSTAISNANARASHCLAAACLGQISTIGYNLPNAVIVRASKLCTKS